VHSKLSSWMLEAVFSREEVGVNETAGTDITRCDPDLSSVGSMRIDLTELGHATAEQRSVFAFH
jgi:hypothetical protein